jgi:serine/threonine protein kinase
VTTTDGGIRGGTTLRHGSTRYELLQRIGGGGFGDVYQARVVGGAIERRVCVKRLGDRIAPAQVRALREEARLLACVRHANVVSLLAFAEDEESGPFLVLELVEGLDLRALTVRLGADRLADGVAVHIACGVLRALAAVQHRLPGLVHRDVTPHNLLISHEGEVKLGDFGIALAFGKGRHPPQSSPLYVQGKPGYMSPEQILGRELDPRSDLFAVGVVLYELLAGARPWGPARSAQEMRAVVEEAHVPLLDRRSSLPSPLVAAVERLIAPDPADRFANAEAALRALAPFGAGELGASRLASIVEAVCERVT